MSEAAGQFILLQEVHTLDISYMCKTPKYDGHSQAWWSHQSPMAYAKVRWYVADTDAKVW